MSLTKTASVDSKAESEPPAGTTTDPSGSSPPQVLKTYQQYAVDYTRLMMQNKRILTMGEDRAPPFITEEFFSMFLAYIGF